MVDDEFYLQGFPLLTQKETDRRLAAKKAARRRPPKLEDSSATFKAKRPKARGKPRRGRGVAEVSTVRVDEETKAVLTKEFGSLGNALYYIYEGIVKFRALHGLAQHEETLAPKPMEPQGGYAVKPGGEPYLFDYADLQQILVTATKAVKEPGLGAEEVRGLTLIQQKLWDYLSPQRVRLILKAEKAGRGRLLEDDKPK